MLTVNGPIEEYLARKSRFVSSKEFEGNGKTLLFNSNRINPNTQGKFGLVIEYTVKEPNSGIERVVNASAATLIRGLQHRLKERPSGTDVPLIITKTGTGTDTRYAVEHANISN